MGGGGGRGSGMGRGGGEAILIKAHSGERRSSMWFRSSMWLDCGLEIVIYQ